MTESNSYLGPYIQHYGIFGMRWGVRRFQNKDGSLTDAGRRRYDALVSKKGTRRDSMSSMRNKYLDKSKTAAGVYSKNGEDYIKKGASLYRLSSSKEKLDSRRKYASVTSTDRGQYQSMSEDLPGSDGAPARYEYEYQAKKNLKVASPDKVREYVLSKYGDTTVKEAIAELHTKKDMISSHTEDLVRDLGDRTLSDLLKEGTALYESPRYSFDMRSLSRKERALVNAVSSFNSSKQASVESAVSTVFYKNALYSLPTGRNETFDHFSKLGYDAIVDLEDAEFGAFEYPVILLNPEKSVTQKSVTDQW